MYRIWKRMEEYSLLLLIGAGLALVWGNLDPAGYHHFIETALWTGGPVGALEPDGTRVLTLHYLINDLAMALFFAVAGKEVWEATALKRGALRGPKAFAPLIATAGGMAGPVTVYLLGALLIGQFAELAHGWAIPTATDIAFALAVLALVGSRLPTALRTFLLTLAVVDDLLAIVVIAIFYTETLHLPWLLLALAPLAAFTVLVQRRVRSWWLLLPLAVATWGLVHASGVHATVAGVLLGFAVPVRRRDGAPGRGLAEHFEHRFRPLSAGLAVPVFAFFAAGVSVVGAGGFAAFGERVTVGVVVGLVVGKTAGILGSTWLLARFTRAELADELSWWDVLGLAMLGGVGFTVSLLVGELAFGAGSPQDDLVKIGVLTGSLLAAALATVILRIRNQVYRRMAEEEQVDTDSDGIPDVYQDRGAAAERPPQ